MDVALRGSRCESETAEPLLLLPDYLAGLSLRADRRATLMRPVLEPAEADEHLSALRRRHGDWLYEASEDFRFTYPVQYVNGEIEIRPESLIRREGPYA